MSSIILFLVFLIVGHHFHKRGSKLVGWMIWGIGLYLIWPHWPHDALHLIDRLLHFHGVGSALSALFLLVAAIVGFAHIFSEKRTVARVRRHRWF
jgi:hypothetical protein